MVLLFSTITVAFLGPFFLHFMYLGGNTRAIAKNKVAPFYHSQCTMSHYAVTHGISYAMLYKTFVTVHLVNLMVQV